MGGRRFGLSRCRYQARTPKRWREIRWHPKSAKRLGLRRPSSAFPNGISNCANVNWCYRRKKTGFINKRSLKLSAALQWIASRKFRCAHPPSACALQFENPQRAFAATDNNSIFVRQRDFSRFFGGVASPRRPAEVPPPNGRLGEPSLPFKFLAHLQRMTGCDFTRPPNKRPRPAQSARAIPQATGRNPPRTPVGIVPDQWPERSDDAEWPQRH